MSMCISKNNILPTPIRQTASVTIAMPSDIFLMDPALKPLLANLLEKSQAIPVPGTIIIQGTTLNIQLLASGKLSLK